MKETGKRNDLDNSTNEYAAWKSVFPEIQLPLIPSSTAGFCSLVKVWT
jgi:hypothetical protein